MAEFDPTFRKRLDNHPAVGSYTPLGGAGGVVLGLVFLAAGGGIAAVGLEVVPVDPATVHAPYWVVTLVGAIFAFPGLGIVLASIRHLAVQARHRRVTAARPDEPWHADYTWPERWAPDRARDVARPFGAAAFITLFLVPFNYLLFVHETSAPLFAKGIMGLFDVVVASIWGYAFYRLGRRIKYAGGRLGYDAFPYLVGQPARVTLHLPKALRGFERLEYTLRCVEERWETRHSSDGKTSKTLVAYARYEDAGAVDAGEIDGRELPLELSVPAGAPASALSDREPTYWELDVTAETPGIDYRGLFLLPVY